MFVAPLIVGKIVYDTVKSDKLNQQAISKANRSSGKMAESMVINENASELMEQQVIRLVNRKRGILATSMSDFLPLYRKIIDIQFKETQGILELNNFDVSIIEETSLAVSSGNIAIQHKGITSREITSFLMFGIVGAISSSIVEDAKDNLNTAKLHAKQLDAVAMQEKTITLSCQAITERVSRMTDVLTKLNIFFIRGIQESRSLINEKGENRSLYSQEDRKTLAGCLNLAKAIKEILDAPIIDESGQLTQKCQLAVDNGEENLKLIQLA